MSCLRFPSYKKYEKGEWKATAAPLVVCLGINCVSSGEPITQPTNTKLGGPSCGRLGLVGTSFGWDSAPQCETSGHMTTL